MFSVVSVRLPLAFFLNVLFLPGEFRLSPFRGSTSSLCLTWLKLRSLVQWALKMAFTYQIHYICLLFGKSSDHLAFVPSLYFLTTFQNSDREEGWHKLGTPLTGSQHSNMQQTLWNVNSCLSLTGWSIAILDIHLWCWGSWTERYQWEVIFWILSKTAFTPTLSDTVLGAIHT